MARRRFNPSLAQANLGLMSRILKPPKGKIDNISCLIEKCTEIDRRQDARTGRLALADETGRAMMMDICPAESGKHLVFNSDRYDTYPNFKLVIRDYVEITRHKPHPMDVGELSYIAYAVGNSTRERTTKRQRKGQSHSQEHEQGPEREGVEPR